MKAAVFKKYGSPQVLKVEEVDTPVPEDNEVLVKIHATSINDWDLQILEGKLMARIENGLIRPRKYQVVGSDIAGQVEAVGSTVVKFKPGDRVYGDLSSTWGGFAEFVCANEEALSIMPDNMTYETAAAIPQAGMLAVQGLIDNGHIQSNQKILINGAGGGVGTFGVQIGKIYDAEMTGIDSSEKLDILWEMGYDYVEDYKQKSILDLKQQYDIILDNKMQHSVLKYLPLLKTGGTYTVAGGSMARFLQLLLLKAKIKKKYNKHVSIVVLKPNKDLAYYNEQFEAGHIKAIIDSTYPLNEISNAMWRFAQGKHLGKIVITM